MYILNERNDYSFIGGHLFVDLCAKGPAFFRAYEALNKAWLSMLSTKRISDVSNVITVWLLSIHQCVNFVKGPTFRFHCRRNTIALRLQLIFGLPKNTCIHSQPTTLSEGELDSW